MKRAPPSTNSAEGDDFLLSLVIALAREAARRDHDSAELINGTAP